MHIYHHPGLKPPTPLRPGAVVEHRNMPGVDLTVVSDAEAGLTGDIYRVRHAKPYPILVALAAHDRPAASLGAVFPKRRDD
ncbi:MAG: hypothetical protein KBA08_12455 [Firmicutes bacterium]|nr:hypothetical protein [Bacillota bacterium]